MVKRFGDVPWYSEVISDKDWDKLQAPRTPRTVVLDSVMADINYAIDHLPEVKTVNEISRWTALALKSRICLFEGTFRSIILSLNYRNMRRFLIMQ